MISVIIPVYNAEHAIGKCVDSIIKQSYTSWELLLIDDGSTDASINICKCAAMDDTRIKVIHKKNGGVSSARNCGLDAAKGEYVCFIDADDYVEIDYLQAFVRNNDADLILSGYTSSEGAGYIPNNVRYEGSELSLHMPSIITSKCIYAPWIKLFRRDIIEKYGIRFDRKLRLGEDTTFVYQYLSHCDSVRFIHNEYYFYDGVFGGGKKYILSYDELDYLNHCNLITIHSLNTKFKTNIDESVYGAKWYLLKNAYKDYVDQDAWEMYHRHHEGITKALYFMNTCNCSATALSQLVEAYKVGDFSTCRSLLQELSRFFTMPATSVNCGGMIQSFAYKMIKKNRLLFLHLLLKNLYWIRKVKACLR